MDTKSAEIGGSSTEYKIQGETLTSIAEPIRSVMGINNSMTPIQMASNLEEVSGLVGEEADLITQIESALIGKGAGSGGEDFPKENVVLRFSFTAPSSTYNPTVLYTVYDDDELFQYYNSSEGAFSVAKGKYITIIFPNTTDTNYGVTSFTLEDGIINVPNPPTNTAAPRAYKNVMFQVLDDAALSLTINRNSTSSGGSTD